MATTSTAMATSADMKLTSNVLDVMPTMTQQQRRANSINWEKAATVDKRLTKLWQLAEKVR